MTPAEQLVEIEAIKQLKARYFRFMDMRDWDGLATTFALDIDFEHPTIGRHRGAAVTLVELKKRLGALSFTAHHGSMPEIFMHSRRTASGIWSLHSCVVPFPPAGAAAMRPLHGYGRYYDTYECQGGGQWRIKSLRLEHLYKET